MNSNLQNNNSNGAAFNEMLSRASARQEEEHTSPANAADKEDGVGEAYVVDDEKEMKTDKSDSPEKKKKKSRKNLKQAKSDFKNFMADDDDDDESVDMSLRSWLGGDIFGTKKFRRQIWYLLLLTVLAIIYVSNRYSYQREEIRHEDLSKQLVDRKFKALTISSELTEYSMRNAVEENLTDTTLRTSTRSSYYLPVDSTENE